MRLDNHNNPYNKNDVSHLISQLSMMCFENRDKTLFFGGLSVRGSAKKKPITEQKAYSMGVLHKGSSYHNNSNQSIKPYGVDI